MKVHLIPRTLIGFTASNRCSLTVLTLRLRYSDEWDSH